ncbi:MAG: flagellar basal body L-ring protein FlgH [Porticoccus sp.]|nr:flagellar basal body L-ring protein FlgH [Porticoccus sp.]MBQ0807748.1 flagellar basal body L-ring protein FlgH [Porticoccus sp.]
MFRALFITLILSQVFSLVGCAGNFLKKEKEAWTPTSIPEAYVPEANGSIYQGSQSFYPLFEDRRPRRVGDILTIMLDEKASASKNSASNASNNSSSSLTPTLLPKGLEKLGDYALEIAGENDFNGSGGSSANNNLTGTITVTVMEVLANGNFKVAGEKTIGINQGTEFIRFAGVVNPRTISGENTVLSTKVADAHIEYTGKGYISDAQKMSWLQRFFMIAGPFL